MKTRTIENADPDTISSPIQPLVKAFLNAPCIWLPERRAELLELQKQHKFRIVIDETDQRFRIVANSEVATITVSLTAMERVWGYCFGLEKLYNFLRVQDSGKEFVATKYPELSSALAVLSAVYQSEKAKKPIAWATELPCPRSSPNDDDVQNANCRFISVASFLLLHEIAHIVLKHPTGKEYVSPEDRRKQELAADLWAMKFTMDRLAEHNTSDEHFIGRSNGIVLGLCILSSVELVHSPAGARDHPGIPERLLTFFSDYMPDHDEPADLREQPKYFAATILDAFLLNEGIEIDCTKTDENLFDPIIAARRYFPA